MAYWRPLKYISLGLPADLMIEIDEAAKDAWLSRTEYIRRLLIRDMSKRQTDLIEKLLRENPLDPRLLDLDDS